MVHVKKIYLPDSDELVNISKTRKDGVFWIIKPALNQPLGDPVNVEVGREFWSPIYSDSQFRDVKQTGESYKIEYTVGSNVIFVEDLCSKGRKCPLTGKVNKWAHYAFDGKQFLYGGPEINDGYLWEWVRDILPAQSVPVWMARYKAEVMDVEIRRVQDIKSRDIYIMNLRWMESIKNNGMMRGFRDWFDRRYSKPRKYGDRYRCWCWDMPSFLSLYKDNKNLILGAAPKANTVWKDKPLIIHTNSYVAVYKMKML